MRGLSDPLVAHSKGQLEVAKNWTNMADSVFNIGLTAMLYSLSRTSAVWWTSSPLRSRLVHGSTPIHSKSQRTCFQKASRSWDLSVPLNGRTQTLWCLPWPGVMEDLRCGPCMGHCSPSPSDQTESEP